MVDIDKQALREKLMENGYPYTFIEKYSNLKEARPIISTASRKNMFIRLPFKGDNISSLIKDRLTAALKCTYYAAKLVFVEETAQVPTSPRKDPVAMLAKSNVISQFTCICGARYAGRTARHLGTRISEHVPKWLISNGTGSSGSAITRHLKETGHRVDPLIAFRILYQPVFQPNLRFAEAVAIRITKPGLCVQKQMVVSLALPW